MREVDARDEENKNGMYTHATNHTYWYHARARRSRPYTTTRIVDYVLVLRARASFLSS